MKKYIFTESQIKMVIDDQINEQMSPEDSFNAVYNNPKIKDQMTKYPRNTNFGFSLASLPKVDNDGANVLYQVKSGETIDGIVRRLGANSAESILWSNDKLKNNPKNLQAGMVIIYSKRPSH
ncbi:MAG: hypothetical protein RIT11_887 [Pseudomonadota bacterium]|jgi:hypothetical protein